MPSSTFKGLRVSLPELSDSLNREEAAVFLHCDQTDRTQSQNREILNLTDGCSNFSIFASSPVTIEIPYSSKGLSEEIDENAIKVFAADRTFASLAPMRPIESYVDVENKKTVATLREQSGQYIAGILKTIERPDRAAPAFSNKTLSALKTANPLTGVPIIAKPQSNSNGDARLSYPLDLPGIRNDFSPSVSIGYASKSGYGSLGEGWHLNIPEITVETRWGVPIYDRDFETETYLFHGEQLVPEAGEAFVGDPTDSLHLVSLPHRTTYLRPRKKGETRFVLRRDDGLWRLIRHGDTPDDYWWEAWQEKPGTGAPKVSYFGRAPGRVPSYFGRQPGSVPNAIEDVANGSGTPQESVFVLRLAPVTTNPHPDSITKWVLAREVDAHRNVIDYDWHLDCQPSVPKDDGTCSTANPAEVKSHTLNLRRILYTSNLAIEETILRCRENPAADKCDGNWALYEILFTWLPPDEFYRRSDAKSGGFLVQSRLLDRIDVRGRQLKSPRLGDASLAWSCSKPFLRYSFAYRGEFTDDSQRGRGRAFIKSITKYVGRSDEIFRPKSQLPDTGCDLPRASGFDWDKDFTTRFAYDLKDSADIRKWNESPTVRADFEKPDVFPIVNQVHDTLFGSDGKGPIAPSMLGTTSTTDSSISFYGGLNLFNYGKRNSFGVKGHSSNRTGYRESTLLLDVDGDGVADLVVRRPDGSYTVHRGQLDANGNLRFGGGLPLNVPDGFPGFNREPFQSTSGVSVEAFPFGGYFGSMSSNASAMQDTYVADVNGDGKPDVVSNGGVFFNTSSDGRLSFSTTQSGSFIDPRNRAGLPPGQVPDLLASVRTNIPLLASEDAPRVDVVRTWRAPFSGDVIVRGAVTYMPRRDPSDFLNEFQETDKDLREKRIADRRDGALFTIEINRGRGWDHASQVRRCFATKLQFDRPPNSSPTPRTITLQTPTPDPKGPVPTVSCYSDNRPGWPSMPDLPAELGPDRGLRVSVEAGDILYFRAHSIDNAQDDVLRFAPSIDYVRLAEDSSAGAAIDHRIVFGAGASDPNLGASAAVASLGLGSSICGVLTITDPTGATTQVNEAQNKICDPWNRSIVRYRLVEEQDRFVSGSGMLIAPFTGRMHFEGTLTKPETLFPGEVAIRILPPPRRPDAAGNPLGPDQNCSPNKWEVPNTRFKSILKFGREKKDYQTADPANKDNLIFLHRGDRVCVFIRFLSSDHGGPDEDVEAIVWPQDMSGFVWKDSGLSALFDRKLLVVQLDKPPPERDPNDLLTDADKAAVEKPPSECPSEDTNPITVKVPQAGDDPNDPTTWPDDPSKWSGNQTLFVYSRCVVFPDRHWVAPRLLGGSYAYFFAGSAPLAGAVQAQRYARRITTVKLPSSALSCPADDTLREYRFKLDIASLKQVAPIPLDQDTRRPEALGATGVPAPAARPPIAKGRMVISLIRDGRVQPVPTHPFIVNIAGQSNPVVITNSHLIGPPAPGATIRMNDPKYLNAQIARHTAPVALPGDARNAFYVEFKEGDPKNINDDGFRIYPLDRVGYSFCAPDQAEVEIATLIDNVAPNDDRGDQLIASGLCGSDSRAVCPIIGVSAHFGANVPADARDVAVPVFAPRRSPIDVESYRGWGSVGITTEFVESMEIDSGTPLENTGVPLSTAKAPKAETPELLPTVRDFNRLRIRLAKRQGPIGVSGTTAQPAGSAALQNGPCNVPAQQCVREKFLSQVRVHALTGSYRDQTDQRPADWIYCIDNGRRRPKSQPEAAAANAGIEQVPRRLQSRIGVDTGTPHFCSIGPDAGLWISDDFMSASRLGRKDLVNPVADTLVDTANAASTTATPDASGGHLVHLLPRVSTTTSDGTAFSVSSGGLGVGSSNTKTNSSSLADVFDLNGDGFPDQIVGNDRAGSQIFFTDPAGRFRCLADEVWAKRYPCVMPAKPGAPSSPVVANAPISITNQFSRKSFGSTSTLSVGSSSPQTFVSVPSNAPGKTGVGSVGTQPTQVLSSRDPIMVPLSPAAEFARGQSYRRSEMIDLNGDGLPDLIPDASNANFNLGFGFIGTSGGWKNGLMEEENNGIGLSAGQGYGDEIEEYGGGLSATSGRSRQKKLMADINGDGLLDVVQISGNEVSAILNTGFGFEEKGGKAVERRVGILPKPLNALGQGESDALGANAYYSYSIPIYLVYWTIYIVVNPGASLGASLNRQVITLRDFDADGLADLMVGGGVNVAGNLNLNFDNHGAVVYRNPFGKHGLLTHVFLASNPQSLKPQPDFNRANFVLDYGRSAPSENDPQSRWVLNEVIVRDGVAIDDAGGVHDRRTCFTYEEGFFDRFERKFLGFAKVTTVEGCAKPGAQRPLVELDAKSQAQLGLPLSPATARDSDQLTGVRKIERTYANRSIYESGILLSETTKDISSPGIVAGAGSPTRTVENTYALFDVGRSSGARQECFRLDVSDGTNAADGRPFMRPMLTAREGGRIAFPNVTRNNVAQGPCHSLPAFDRGDALEINKGQYLYGPQRLTPVLVQSVETLTEGDATKLTTAMQFAIDYRGRVAHTCDLGRLGDPAQDGTVNEDDICAKYDYDDRIQLSFIHGATGGGTLAFDRRDRVQRIEVRTGKHESGTPPDRLRTAKYDVNNGDLVALCQFENVNAGDLCSAAEHFPLRGEELRLGNQLRVAVRHYHYDEFGNLDRYVSPAAADGHFLSRRIGFDQFMHVVELREDTDYCGVDPKAAGDGTCLAGSTSMLGTFTSRLGDVDWRHAVATTQIDVNKNAIHTVLDGAGRPTAVFASWAGKWAEACGKGECVSAETAGALKSSASWGKLLAYEYRVPHEIVHDVKVDDTVVRFDESSAVARITRFADAALYKKSGDAGVGVGRISFDTDQHFDQLGRLVRTISPADICIPESETPDGAVCDAAKRATHTASGIISLDIAEREVEDFMPVPINGLPTLDLASVVAFPNENISHGPRTTIVSDGLDRPLHIRLADGNSYAFKYKLANDNNVVRHRTIIRDAQCVPTAMDRDERGLIRTVHEFMNAGAGDVFDAHAVGASFNRSDKPSIIAAGWVKDIDYSDAHQQTTICVQGEASISGTPGPAIVTPLTDPLLDGRAGRRRSSTVYDYDAFSQLVGVHLPNSTAVLPTTSVVSGSRSIRVAYDALGRRSHTNDPDRGFDQLSYDPLSNLVCHRSGPPVANGAFTDTVNLFRTERERRAPGGTEQRLNGEDFCLAPEAPNRAQVSRVVRNEYIYDRLSKVFYRYPSPVDGNNKTVSIEYGHSDDAAANRAGRQIKLTDVTGTTTTVSYHPLGMPEKIEKAIRAVARAPFIPPPNDIGTFATTHSYDSWGLLHRSVLGSAIRAIRIDGTNDDSPGTLLTVSETLRYRYSPADQASEVLAGSPCPAAPDGKEDCTNVSRPKRVLADAAFDERGNTLRVAFGNGVVTRNEFDLRSNRLLSSSSRLGVPCVEYGPGDDCSNSAPPILFQNLSYAYDAAGNLTEYDNRPRYADLCSALPARPQCPEISQNHARLQGLIITGSKNLFAYDERSRLKSAQKEVSIFGQNYEYSVVDDATFSNAKKAEIKISELFAFADSHLLTGIQRSIAPEAFDHPNRITITHAFGTARATAPDTTAINMQSRNEQRTYHLDDFGRIDSVQCSDCFVAPGPDKPHEKVVTQSYKWDPDDTLAMVRRRIEPPPTEDQRIKLNRDSRYFANVYQTYDYAGNRAIKRWIAEIDRTAPERKLMRETVYANEQLTVTREPGKKPEALLHIFAGSMRLASKWVGAEGIFTYHTQLPTRSVSDVIYARGDDPTTGRLHQQFEYAPFGQLLVGREMTIPQANRDPTDHARLTRPLYRFDAKEYDDETNLTNFGARHYNQRLGLWLSPDPELPSYLAKTPNNGVFAPKNLAAYGFGWGNPIGRSDVDGRYPVEAYLFYQVLGPLEIESIPTRTLYPNYTPNLSAPKGENLSMSLRAAENMSWAELIYRSAPTSLNKKTHGMFSGMSVFDVKAQGRQYEDWGNFMFGARSAAMGIPLEYAARAGGPWQETPSAEKRTFPQKFKEAVGPFPFGDDPKDVGHIIEGYRYYQATQGKFFGPSLPPQLFVPSPKPKD